MSWASDFPEELLCRPMGLVVLTGLDITYNAVHKSIWDSFCNNRRQDRVPLKFRVFEADHEYPKGRSKRTSYEWYIPKGILKTSWMHKHLERMPAVVVVFYDLDWDEHMWKEKQMECATRVEIVRSTLVGRGTKVAVVLIQKNTPLPPGEDVIAAERAASLCSACELSAKSLFVLPHSDHLLGYTIRLENAFYELSQSYYYAEARRVKSHKEFLNKTTHQLLYVRHQFKIGFLNELKQDSHIALKHYKQAYGHAVDLRMHDTNMLEAKTIACFINYKICRLSFQHNVPLDAIAQFRKHIDFFKSKIGSPDLAFEHSAWMSKQFQVFGDLFDEAIKLGLTAVQTQHPGFYYQQAANHAIARKQLCRGLCHALAASPVPDPLENLNNLDFYGQRPWRQGHQSIDPPDSVKEKEGIKALQALEITVDHSWLIIPLLSSAVSQFKKYKSPRMKRYLMVQMGEEYYHAKDYNKGLTILSRVTWDYRQERWWPLLTSILITSLRCAYLIGNVEEYVTICLELMGKNILCSPEEKTRIQMNLIRVMSNDAPEPEPGCDADCVEKAKSLWKTDTSTREANVFTVEMNNIIPFIECKARFTHATFKADTPVELDVFLRMQEPTECPMSRTSCPFPIKFSKLSALLNNVAYNEFCSVTDTEGISSMDESSKNLYLLPGEPKRQTFTFIPLKEDVGKQIHITSVALEFGSENARCAILHWSSEAITSQSPPHGVIASQHMSDVDRLPWDKIHTSPTTSITPRESQLEISLDHSLPSLMNEFYCVKFSIDNKEENVITDISLSVGLTEGQDQIMEQTTHICVDQAEYDGKVISKKMGINLGSLQPGEQISRNLFIKCLQVGDRTISAKVMYNVVVDVNQQQITCMCNKEEKWELPVVTPFEASVILNSLKFETIEAVHGDEPFLLLSELICTSPWALEIKSSDLKLSPYVQSSDGNLQSQVEGLNLEKDERATECHCLIAPPSIQPSVPLGMYTIHWRRKEHNNILPYVSTTLTLPTIPVEHVPLFVDAELPSHGSVRVCLPAVYTIYNRTGYVQEMEVNMENSECFMFSGHKHVHVRILPSNNHQLTFNLFPLMTGFIELPKLQVNMLRYPGVFNDVVQKMLPTHIFIKPSGKEMQPTLV